MGEGENRFKGKCFCGAVELEVSGEPLGMGYCHCGDCRSWSASPVNAFTLWKTAAVKITRGQEQVAEFHKTARSHRQWCKVCGGHLMTLHPEWDLVDVYAATLPDLPFKAGVHVNYERPALRLHDGLPKLRDFPKELGGSGQPVAE